MTQTRSVRRWSAFAPALLLALTLSRGGFADDPKKAASAHFQQGITLFGEADFSAALVEFRTAYSIYPDVNALYNIGETEFQLQRYAAALGALEKYLADGGTLHRAEAQEQVVTLRGRVGKIAISSNVAGAEVLVDDEPVGTTPLGAPVLATVGHRKVQLNPPGGAPLVRYADVASNETATLAVNLDPTRESARVTTMIPTASPSNAEGTRTRIIVGWSVTGAFAVATAVTGGLALHAASSLEDARERLDPDPANVDDKHSTLKTFAIATDVLGAATVVAAGISLYWTLAHRSSTRSASASRTLTIIPGGVTGTF